MLWTFPQSLTYIKRDDNLKNIMRFFEYEDFRNNGSEKVSKYRNICRSLSHYVSSKRNPKNIFNDTGNKHICIVIFPSLISTRNSVKISRRQTDGIWTGGILSNSEKVGVLVSFSDGVGKMNVLVLLLCHEYVSFLSMIFKSHFRLIVYFSIEIILYCIDI